MFTGSVSGCAHFLGKVMKAIELTNEMEMPKTPSELIPFLKVALKIAVLASAVYAVNLAWVTAKAEAIARHDAYMERWLDRELDGLMITIDHQKGIETAVTEATPRQLKKTVYYNRIQIDRLNDLLSEIVSKIQVEDAMGAKVFN